MDTNKGEATTNPEGRSNGSRAYDPTKFRPLRTWPALLLVALIFVARFGPKLLEGGPSSYWMVEVFGPMETVVCYDANTGREVWNRQTEGRLDDPLGGPGPRATPTLASGGLFVTEATGTFLRLDPATGEVVWKQDLPTSRVRVRNRRRDLHVRGS
jgi:outer membrane protein assembly factor BamB